MLKRPVLLLASARTRLVTRYSVEADRIFRSSWLATSVSPPHT